MSGSCHEPAVAVKTPQTTVIAHRVALAGNPNVGKTTLFNLLTGLRQKVANYPGVTVERKSGRLVGHESIEVVDLPGTYSLNPRSIDERVAYDVLVGRMPGEPAPDVVVCVVDATNLERNLYLVSQIMDLGLPVVVALNMMDALAENGLELDVDGLARRLGIPVVPIVARKGEGIDRLKEILLRGVPPPPTERRWTLMPAVATVVEELARQLGEEVPALPARQRFFEALNALTSDTLLEAWKHRAPRFYEAVRAARQELEARNVPYRQAEMIGRYGWLSPLVASVLHRHPEAQERTLSDRIDAVLTHRVAGPLIFLGILLLIFQAIFSWAVPFMDAIETAVAWTGEQVRTVLPDGFLEDLIVDGAITGVGNVLVFLPQILLLFFFLGLMEDTGYMARTAFIMDRLMRRLGLSGASVVPLLSGYACAVPAIMAARTLDNERDRIITIMVTPLMSCSARLPVYTLFIAAFIPNLPVLGPLNAQGLAMFSLYLLGTTMAFAAAWVLKTFVFKGESAYFVMELPPYRAPQFKQILYRMIDRAKAFVTRAGKIIFGLSIVIWFLASFPRAEQDPELAAQRAALEVWYSQARDSLEALGASDAAFAELEATYNARLAPLMDAEAARQISQSFIGRLGHALEPLMRPLGFDWKITAGIISSFPAREVIVGTMATIYGVAHAGEDEVILRQALQADPAFSPLVAVSLMVFYVFALQCMSTLAIARRELGSWKWPAVMWTYMFALAYLFSLVVYQGGRWLGLD
ncbi:ferrous iron transport protein B [Rhodothermus profundi]|uniref:Ferrous iron transport protein B n=1 Tax=Rhodothermus profundi TaxID=633813 RepID=A0A1M6TP15_9BACT|nr:ferrous iron transport protein B [Rhodothermus profundi]SHK58674.1 ferrous iron transport protein B [Rhodothermus profundi]